MHDWEQFVRQRLAGMEINDFEAALVIEELAGHLEEQYQSLLREGLSDENAVRRLLSGVGNWRQLKRNVERSRKTELIMNKRVSQFWFPAFLTLFLAMVFLMLIQLFGPDPWMPHGPSRWRSIAPVATIYIPWLFCLPFVGALGAYVSRRAGASVRTVFSSVLFPVLPYSVFFWVALPVTMLVDDHFARNLTVPLFFVGLSAWVIFPAVALLAGSRLLHFLSSRSLISGGVARS